MTEDARPHGGPGLFFRKARAFIAKDFFEEVSYKFYFFFTLFNVFFAVLIFFLLARVFPEEGVKALARYGGGYFPFVLVGFALTHYLDLALHGMGRKIREAQILGTFEALLATRTPAWQILLLTVLYPFIFTSLIIVIYIFAGWAFFGLDLSKADWPSAALLFLLTGTSLAPFGIFSAAAIVIIKRGEPTAYIITGLSYLVSGVLYPISVLPDWLQTVAKALPLTHALEAMRMALLSGVSLWDMPGAALILILFSVLLLPLSLWLFARVLQYARKTGGLHHY